MGVVLIGIDPGTSTGVAILSGGSLQLHTLKIHQAFKLVERVVWEVKQLQGGSIRVYLEDARQRKWFGDRANAKQQGAGSIKRDCTIWEDFLSELAVEVILIAPKNNKTKLTQLQFEKISGYKGRTSEHSRDAAMLILGRDGRK
jgi:hypothetical protein